MARKCFYSFHYKEDNWRASTVRSIGKIEGNAPVNDNAWEMITAGGDLAIKRWINNQLIGRSCTIVLVGRNTANRKWINYEITQSWKKGMGVVGIHIHGLQDRERYVVGQGDNPFRYLTYRPTNTLLASIAKCYNPCGANSKERYAWISRYILDAVEEAITIRSRYT